LTTVEGSSEESTGLLNREQIERKIGLRKIFANDDWDPDCLRPAAYDVRVAGTGLRLPGDEPQAVSQERLKPFILRPGDVAFVSTVERFILDESLSATVSPKYQTVTQGLLLLHGGLIDPGFGKRTTTKGQAGEPLGFVIANVSTDDVVITPRVTKVARIQFTQLAPRQITDTAADPAEDPERGPTEEAEEVRERPHPSVGLEFFSQMERTRRKVNRVARQSENLVLFGVYLIAFAAIGAVAAVLIAVLSSEKPAKAANAVPDSWIGAGLIVVTILALAAAAWAIVRSRVRMQLRDGHPGRVARARSSRERGTTVRMRASVARQMRRQETARKELRGQVDELKQLLAEARAESREARELLEAAKARPSGP
jgi:deoxycytidine triphosphate deaminase